jgi:hypothetical protein
MAMKILTATSGRTSTLWKCLESSKMAFCIGDEVRDGTRVGIVTDVGTVLVQVQTGMGTSRMVCPWELVRLRATPEAPRSVTPTPASSSVKRSLK